MGRLEVLSGDRSLWLDSCWQWLNPLERFTLLWKDRAVSGNLLRLCPGKALGNTGQTTRLVSECEGLTTSVVEGAGLRGRARFGLRIWPTVALILVALRHQPDAGEPVGRQPVVDLTRRATRGVCRNRRCQYVEETQSSSTHIRNWRKEMLEECQVYWTLCLQTTLPEAGSLCSGMIIMVSLAQCIFNGGKRHLAPEPEPAGRYVVMSPNHHVGSSVLGSRSFKVTGTVSRLGLWVKVIDIQHNGRVTSQHGGRPTPASYCPFPLGQNIPNHSALPARLPPRRFGFNSRPDTPDFRMWEFHRTMPLASGFSLGSPVSPAPSFRCCSILTYITLIGSEDLDVKSSPNISTPLFAVHLPVILVEIVDSLDQLSSNHYHKKRRRDFCPNLPLPGLKRSVDLRVQGQEARERYGRHEHARLVPYRSYAHGVQCFRRGPVLCKSDLVAAESVTSVQSPARRCDGDLVACANVDPIASSFLGQKSRKTVRAKTEQAAHRGRNFEGIDHGRIKENTPDILYLDPIGTRHVARGEHCMPVQGPSLSGDGAHDGRDNVSTLSHPRFSASNSDVALLESRFYTFPCGGRGGEAVSLLASHQGKPGSIPGRNAGLSQVGIVPDDVVGRWVFSGISRFSRPFISAPLHIHFHHPHWLSRPKSRPNLFTSLTFPLEHTPRSVVIEARLLITPLRRPLDNKMFSLP
ncbi:hypothetical protein PR048_008730 [Dryococelus australis]|uniref:Uncharacterized protein n=1 Tax=Dryococelus australis TaxID=614101 RepID=A0ABQ9HXY0_9NEOP|nr:hypothetical protein PR048_008730 [Dryococelus australis]